ncbi:(S)-benzoin forming benzil reductase [Siminovitchia fortis]|uniref:(S)-benzoin forming benzil reductase n=1 Tax=Siminovitchia fortis TaxID=254758 RepID=A0A451GBQ3_9BACI|nr:(S)-benzoin forming benzil reductase [Siminovitchia fortis]RWR12461.1 (S)-benzoin forming benzil reductase [Siminovitchia fortis]WHY83511.1 (S)-benzoin forming benzil reductase [Siminovitchia fortis]
MDVFFITGASRGIGLALSKELMGKNNVLVCMARSKNEELEELAKHHGGKLAFLEFDLTETSRLEELMDSMISYVPEFPGSITLINNAGVIEPIGHTEDNSPAAIEKSIAVNLTAPMILTSAFIRKLKDKHVPKRVVNISSGAGRHAYTGWSSYCAGKAGLDHYSNAVALEQKKELFGVKIVSVAPGIIDTDMQKEIRKSDKQEFELVDQFIEYKKKGLLSSPEETAGRLARLIQSDKFFEMDVLLDLRNI